MKKFWRNNSLSIVLVLVAAACLLGEAISGWKRENENRADHGKPAQPFSYYLRDPDFIEATAENWESEFLQMAMFVWLTGFLYQKGSAESKDPDFDDEESNRRPNPGAPDAPAIVKHGGWRLALYQRSLAPTLAALFLVAFLIHAWASRQVYAENEVQHGRGGGIGFLRFLGTSYFWFESFQNWQSEFVGVLTIVILSIFLRQRGSPESKPVDAPHRRTGRS